MKPQTNDPDRDVTARLARYARSRDLRALWPSLDESALTAARRAIESVVRAVLAGAKSVPLAAKHDVDAYALKVASYTTGTGAILGRWIDDGRVHADAPVRPLLLHELEQGRRRAARIEREVLPAIDALLASGVTPVILKGFHTGRVYFDEPGLRPCADVDIAVPPKQVHVAERALEDAGFVASPKRFHDPFEVHWKGRNVDGRVFSLDGVDERNRWEIDLHDSFDRLISGQHVRLDEALRHVAPFQVAGRALLAPAQPLLLVYQACLFASDLLSMRPLRLIEFVQVVRADRAKHDLDWDQVTAHMKRTDSVRYALPLFELAERLSPGIVPAAVLSFVRMESTWAVKRSVARLQVDGGVPGLTSVRHYLMWVRNPVDLVRLFRALLTEAGALSPRRSLTRAAALVRRLASGSVALWRSDESPS